MSSRCVVVVVAMCHPITTTTHTHNTHNTQHTTPATQHTHTPHTLYCSSVSFEAHCKRHSSLQFLSCGVSCEPCCFHGRSTHADSSHEHHIEGVVQAVRDYSHTCTQEQIHNENAAQVLHYNEHQHHHQFHCHLRITFPIWQAREARNTNIHRKCSRMKPTKSCIFPNYLG
jgi:hypothetical protein